MESKENKNKQQRQQQLGISSAPATTSNKPPHGSSQEDEPSDLPSSSQPVTARCSGSLKHGSERDDTTFPREDETKSPHLTMPEDTLQDWQNEIDDLSAPKIDLPMTSYAPKPPEGQHEDPFLASTSKVGTIHGKVTELRNIAQGSSKISRVQEYWNALSTEKKRNFLEVSVHDLRVHHVSRRGELAGQLITEAVSYIESNKTWVFRVCFICNQIFRDQESHRKHVWLHIGNFSSELLLHFPKEIDASWAEMLAKGIWQPFDFSAVVNILHSQRASQFPTGVASSDVRFNVDDNNNDRFSEISVQAMNFDSEAGIEDKGVESGEGSGSSSSNLVDGNEIQEAADPITKGWPLSNDPERLELLRTIRAQLLLLMRHRCLTKIHMIKIMENTTRCLKKFATDFEPLAYGLDKTYACICLLDIIPLKNLLAFLVTLSRVAYDSENKSDEDYTCSVDAPVSGVQNGISLSDDLSHLILNVFLSTIDAISTSKNSIHDCSTDPVRPKDGVVGREDFICWIYTSTSTDEELKSWIHSREQKRCLGVDIFAKLRRIFNEIQNLLMEKQSKMRYIEVLVATWRYCCQQRSNRSKETECIPPESFEAILRKRQEALAEGEDNLERDFIALVLKEVQVLDGTQSIHGNISSSSDSNSSTQDSLHLSDSSIKSVFIRQDRAFSVEVSVIDVNIRKRIAFIRQLKCKLAAISALDYMEIISFLVKKFLQEHLEGLADEEAEMKSDAAREGLLAELELEEKNNIKKGHSNSKQTKKKLNKKKKKKDQSRDKDTAEKSVPTNEENAEQAPFPYATKIEVNKRGEIVVTEREHDLKQLGTAFGRYTELEADESLDHQWEIVKPKKRSDIYEKRSGMYVDNAKARKESPTGGVSDTGYEDRGQELQQSKQISLQHDHCPVSLTLKPGDEMYGDQRFQADLEKAIQESIESFQEQKDLLIEKASTKSSDDCRDSCTKVVAGIENRRVAIREGLKNDADDDCIIGAILQSLWWIKRFREEFLRKSKSLHQHVGDPCIVCDLYDVFMALYTQPTETYRKAVSHSDLKITLSGLCDSESFQEEKMNDAAKVLNAIFNCLHRSCTSGPGPSDIVSKGDSGSSDSVSKGGSGPSDTLPRENKIRSWDCTSEDCMAHDLFGMDILEMKACCNCTVESRCQKCTSFVHFVNANELQKMQIASFDRSLDELLKHAKNTQYTCNPENGGCGSRNYIHLIRATAPHVFIAVLQQSTLESGDDTSTALAAINTEFDIGIMPRDLCLEKRYSLISVICRSNELYSCFVYSAGVNLWFLYGNTPPKIISGCDDLFAMIRREKLQPLVLFFQS